MKRRITLFIITSLAMPLTAFGSPGGDVIGRCWEQEKENDAAITCEIKRRDALAAELRADLEKRRVVAHAYDEWMRQSGADMHSEKDLGASQRAFEDYMQQECERQIDVTPGSAHREEGCKIDLMTQRMQLLEEY